MTPRAAFEKAGDARLGNFGRTIGRRPVSHFIRDGSVAVEVSSVS